MKPRLQQSKRQVTTPGKRMRRDSATRSRARLFRYEFVGLFALLIIMVVVGLGSIEKIVLRSGHTQLAAVISTSLIDLLNADRTSNGLPRLSVNEKLVTAAEAKAQDMASRGYFAHQSPGGIEPWYWFERAGYAFQYAGENLAIDFADSSDVESAWMQSPTHRANIVNPHYTEVGIATAVGMYQGHETTFVVQEFGAPLPPATRVASSEALISLETTRSGSIVSKKTSAPAKIRTVSANEAQSVVRKSVLGEAVQKNVPPPVPVVAPVVQESVPPAIISNAIRFPRSTLSYLYYVFAGMILLAFAIETEFEWHRKHLQTATMAGGMLAFILIIFVTSHSFVFSSPILTQSSAMTATVGSL